MSRWQIIMVSMHCTMRLYVETQGELLVMVSRVIKQVLFAPFAWAIKLRAVHNYLMHSCGTESIVSNLLCEKHFSRVSSKF